MISNYIDLDRRFIDLNGGDPDDDPHEALRLRLQGKPIGMSWSDLLKKDVIVILGAAGSGKTREVLHQADALRKSGLPSFVLPLDALCKRPFDQSFSSRDPGALPAFRSWKLRGGKAVLFLDGLDEARLPSGFNGAVLEAAFSNLARAFGDRGRDVKIVLTTRGSEWWPEDDLPLLTDLVQSLRRRADPVVEISMVRFADLSREAVHRMAQAHHMDGDAFLTAVERTISFNMIRQPLETLFVIELWAEALKRGVVPNAVFSSRERLFSRIVRNRLQAETGGERRSNLDPRLAEQACEKLAAACVVAGIRDIIVRDTGTDVVRAIDVLSNDQDPWADNDVRQLLSSGIFHPSVAGKSQFAHRELQDYLAARFFDRAVKANAGALEILAPLVATGLGSPQIMQQHQHVAGWLATLNPVARRYFTSLAPSLLMETGDPTQMSIDERVRVLTQYMAKYDTRDYTGEFFYTEDVQKFARPGMEGAVRHLLTTVGSVEGRQLLLKIAKLGQLHDLHDVVCSIVEDINEAWSVRQDACEALDSFAMGHLYTDRVRAAARAAKLTQPLPAHETYLWNEFHASALKFIYRTTKDIADVAFTVGVLLREPKNVGSSTSRILDEAIGLTNPAQCPEALEMLLAAAAADVRKGTFLLPGMVDRLRMLSNAIGGLTLSIIKADALPSETEVLTQAIEYLAGLEDIAFMGKYEGHFDELKVVLQQTAQLKFDLVARRIALFPQHHGTHMLDYYVLHPFNEVARDVFSLNDVQRWSAEIGSAVDETSALSAFEIAEYMLNLFRNDASYSVSAKQLYATARRSSFSKVRAKGGQGLKRPPLSYKLKYEYPMKARAQYRRASTYLLKKYSVLRNYWKFGRNRERIRHGLAPGWLSWAADRRINELGRPVIDALKKDYGIQIAAAFEDGFKAFWRKNDLATSTYRDAFSRMGLVGLSLEAESCLVKATRAEAALAFRLAFSALNSLPDWCEPLAQVHPEAFREVAEPLIAMAMAAPAREIEMAGDAISKISYTALTVQSIVAPFIFNQLLSIAPVNREDLRLSVGIISRSHGLDRFTLINFLAAKLDDAFSSSGYARAWIWLDALFAVDAALAVTKISEHFGETPTSAGRLRLLDFLGQDRRRTQDAVGERDDLRTNIPALKHMIKLVFEIHPPGDDVWHEEVHSPGLLDNVADTRRAYVESITRIGSQDAMNALLELADDVDLTNHRDSFLWQVDKLARQSAVAPQFTSHEAVLFLNGLDKVPSSSDELKILIERHVKSLLKQLRENDDDEGRVYRHKGGDENDLSNWLSARLREVGSRLYSSVREQQNAGATRPDIRLDARDPELGQFPIEVKLVDKGWSGNQLLDRLQNQLFSQYMMEERSQHGFFVLVNAAAPRLQKSIGGRTYGFTDLVHLIRTRADVMNATLPAGKTVTVIGLELPLTTPAEFS